MVSQIDNFSAGRLKNFLKEWQRITSDPVILDIIVACRIQFIDNLPPNQERFSQQNFNSTQTLIIEEEISKLLQVNVLKEVQWNKNQFLSPIFLRPKKNKEYRMILNLKKLNEYVPYKHVKMNTFETAITLVRKVMFMCTMDIKHAYYSVPIAENDQKFLRFLWRGKVFQYTCLPNGYRDGPRLFTKLLKPVFAKLRAEGHLCTGFIDDSFFMRGDI